MLGCGETPTPAPPAKLEPVLTEAPKTPAKRTVPWGEGSQASSLFSDGETLHLVWMETQPASQKLRYSSLTDGSWSEATTVAGGPDLVVNFADTPQIAKGGDGALYVSWPRKSGDDTYAYDVVLGRSIDEGQTWTELGSPHRDGTETEHGFVSLVPERTGVLAVWLDGRAMPDGPMSLRGASISAQIGEDHLLDDRVCDCCGTDAASTVEGPVVVYRDRTVDEVRDIGVIRHEGLKWAVPSMVFPDRWKVAGCPVNGPRILAKNRTVDVIWFTAEPEPAVKFASSPDGGRSFGRPMRFAGKDTLGRVDLVADSKGSVVLTWMDQRNEKAIIRASRFLRTGGATKPIDIASLSPSRSSGFPRIAVVGEDLFVIWTEAGPPLSLEYERVPLSDLSE